MTNALDQAMKSHERALVLCQELNNHTQKWTDDLDNFKLRQVHLLGDAVVGSALVTYGGLLDREYRGQLRRAFRRELSAVEVRSTAAEDCLGILADDKQRCMWHKSGLPHSHFQVQCAWALENCAIAHTSPRTTIFIDPDDQVLWWFRQMQAEQKLQHLDGREDYFATLCESMTAGEAVALTIGEEIDPFLYSILTQKIIRKGKEQYLL
eukprot:3169105-Rhodomonas_salina.1